MPPASSGSLDAGGFTGGALCRLPSRPPTRRRGDVSDRVADVLTTAGVREQHRAPKHHLVGHQYPRQAQGRGRLQVNVGQQWERDLLLHRERP